MTQLDRLKRIVLESKQQLDKKCNDWNMELDSANFQTKSKEDFKKYLKVFEQEGLKFLLELSHAGRKIVVFQVPEDLLETYFGLSFVELSEPKPNKELEKTEWEYVSYIVDDYDKFLESECSEDNKLNKVRAVADAKFCYYAPLENRVQFRNRSIAKADNDTGSELKGDSDIQEKQARVKLMADFDNYRKSTEERMAKMQQLSGQRIVERLVEIVDDFERAIGQGKDQGVESIYEKLTNLIKDEGFAKIEVQVGDKFDPNTMEAISTVPTPDQKQDNSVQEILLNGYRHAETGHVLRMAKVVVSKAE